MNEVERWITPFDGARHPSVGLISEPRGDSTLTLVVAPKGVETYPKVLVHFSSVYAFTCEEEAASELSARIPKHSLGAAFIWSASPSVQAYSQFKEIAFRGSGRLRHYVLAGGDNVVGVVTAAEPAFEEVNKPTQMNVTHAV